MAKKIVRTGAKISVEFSVNKSVSAKWLTQFVESAIANEMATRNSPASEDKMTVSDINASIMVLSNEYEK